MTTTACSTSSLQSSNSMKISTRSSSAFPGSINRSARSSQAIKVATYHSRRDFRSPKVKSQRRLGLLVTEG